MVNGQQKQRSSATAKILHRDVFTFHNFKWLRYHYQQELSPDALYLDNWSGLHVDAVIWS